MQEKLRRAWRFNYLSHFLYSSWWDWGGKAIIQIYARTGWKSTKDRSRSNSHLIVKALCKTFHCYIYIYVYINLYTHTHTHLWRVSSYSQCKGDEREETAEICKKKEAGAFWCSVCVVNAEMTVERSERPGQMLKIDARKGWALDWKRPFIWIGHNFGYEGSQLTPLPQPLLLSTAPLPSSLPSSMSPGQFT